MLIVHLSICVRVNNYSIQFQLPNNAKIQNSALSDRSEEVAEPKCSLIDKRHEVSWLLHDKSKMQTQFKHY